MLRVLTLNLWNTSGGWAERSECIREWLDRLSPDVIGFQEAVAQPGRDQVAELMDGRGYHLDFVAASPFWEEDREEEVGVVGNALASRFPILERAELRLPDAGDGELRAVLSVTLEAPWGPTAVTVTHLNWKLDHGWVRERQVAELCDFVRARAPRKGFPPLMLGDFNAEPDSAEIRYVQGLQSAGGRSVCFLDAWRTAGDGGAGFTWSNDNPHAARDREPDRRIDYVFAGLPQRNGLGQFLACRVVCHEERDGVWPSDHFGVYAELRTEPVGD
ncbi:MAG: endonuclease/exonuclease/phosphatase family protein [Myxococcota bacterium]|nr:endonuclease/exonuclease/phosphatase family protein [Myxococcota bacterium]